MSKKIGRLVNCLSLGVGEDLASHFIRLSNRQYDSTPEGLVNFCQKHLPQPDVITCPTHPETYRLLIELTGLNSDELYGATLHRLAEMISPAGKHLNTQLLPSKKKVALVEPAVVSNHIWPETTAQFCPHCLKAGTYHRLRWRLQAVSACLEHQCLLVQNCPGCQAQVSIQDIVNRYCDRCASDLSNSPTLSLAEDGFGLLSQQIIQAWFENVAVPVKVDTLPKHPPATLYQVAFGLQRAIRAIRQQWDYLHHPFNPETMGSVFPCQTKSQLTPLKFYLLYATALKGLLDWPHGFYEFLTAYQLRDQRVPTDKVREDLGYLYSIRSQPDWQQPAFEFLRQALGTYLQEHHQYNFALKQLYRLGPHRKSPLSFDYIGEVAAARKLQLPPLIVKRLVQLGHLGSYQPPQSHPNLRRFNLVKYQDVLKLQKNWRREIPLAEVAGILGISEETTLDLAMEELIRAERSFRADADHPVKIKTQSLAEFISRLQKGSVHIQYGQQIETINLIEATRRVSYEGGTMVFLLKRILAGELRAFWPPDLNDLAHLSVSTEDLKKLTGKG